MPPTDEQTALEAERVIESARRAVEDFARIIRGGPQDDARRAVSGRFSMLS
jgi:hypothetical protein